MKVTVLGSGGFGYPLPFCDCEYCRQSRLLGGKNIRKRASILINEEMIIDLTPDCQTAMNMYGKDMSKTKYLLQTHTHLDRFDINQFVSLDYKYESKRGSVLNLICSKPCFDDICDKVSQYDKMDLRNDKYLSRIKLKPQLINYGETLNMGDYIIKGIHCNHDEKIGAQLYLIKQKGKSLLYATDTSQITQTALEELLDEKIDCVFLDESFGVREYMFSHLNIKGFDEFVKELSDKNILSENCKIYATHMTHDGNPLHDELEQILNKYGYSVAYDGMELNL